MFARGMWKDGFAVHDALRAVIPSIVDRPKMLDIMVGTEQEDNCCEIFHSYTRVICYRTSTAHAYTSAGPLSLKQKGVFTFVITSGHTNQHTAHSTHIGSGAGYRFSFLGSTTNALHASYSSLTRLLVAGSDRRNREDLLASGRKEKVGSSSRTPCSALRSSYSLQYHPAFAVWPTDVDWQFIRHRCEMHGTEEASIF